MTWITLGLVIAIAIYSTNSSLLENDGILVEHKGDARTVDGLWNILVIIHPVIVPDIDE